MSEVFLWGRRHRAYIAALDAGCKLSARDFAEMCGYGDVSKFQRRRQHWRHGRPSGKGHIPIGYLAGIHVDLCELAKLVEKDREDYLAALRAIHAPAEFTVYGQVPGFSIRKSLPAGLSIPDAVRHVQQLLDTGAFPPGKAMLEWPSLKTVFIRKNMAPSEHIWPPRMLALSHTIDFGGPLEWR